MRFDEKTKFKVALLGATGLSICAGINVLAQSAGGGLSGVNQGTPPLDLPPLSPVGVEISPSPTPTDTSSPGSSASSSPAPESSPTQTPAAGASAGETGSSAPSASPSSSATPALRQLYSATLAPANGSGASGTVNIVVDQGRLGVSVQASGLAPAIQHAMHIHQGTACAGIGADVNGDGFIDPIEGEAISGPPMIPLSLSGDLSFSSPEAASNLIYPRASVNGNLSYINAGAIASLGALPPPLAVNPKPGATATPAAAATPNGGFDLTGRVVEIHGVGPTFNLPSSARSDEPGKTVRETLPVACGIVVRAAQ